MQGRFSHDYDVTNLTRIRLLHNVIKYWQILDRKQTEQPMPEFFNWAIQNLTAGNDLNYCLTFYNHVL